MSDLLRISLLGTLPTGEEWTVNPVWGLGDFDVPTTPAGVQTVASAIANVTPTAAVSATWGPLTSMIGVRVEARKYNGELQNQAEATRAAPFNGTSTLAHPLQVAAVQSLRTALPGASGRGRLYWPATGMSLQQSNSRPTPAAVANLLAAYVTFLGGINTAIRATYPTSKLVVWSRKNLNAQNVTSTQMGDVMDVQRRRRDTLVEAYTSQAWP